MFDGITEVLRDGHVNQTKRQEHLPRNSKKQREKKVKMSE